MPEVKKKKKCKNSRTRQSWRRTDLYEERAKCKEPGVAVNQAGIYRHIKAGVQTARLSSQPHAVILHYGWWSVFRQVGKQGAPQIRTRVDLRFPPSLPWAMGGRGGVIWRRGRDLLWAHRLNPPPFILICMGLKSNYERVKPCLVLWFSPFFSRCYIMPPCDWLSTN